MKKIPAKLKKDIGAIVLGSDHGGFELKNVIIDYLKQQGIECQDEGVNNSKKSVDYPDYARKAISFMLEQGYKRAILVCGTGQGMDMAANKCQDIRAALGYDEYSAEMSRLHNDSNVLCLGQRALNKLNGYDPGGSVPGKVMEYAIDIVYIWLTTPFEGGRHERRVKKIAEVGKLIKRC